MAYTPLFAGCLDNGILYITSTLVAVCYMAMVWLWYQAGESVWLQWIVQIRCSVDMWWYKNGCIRFLCMCTLSVCIYLERLYMFLYMCALPHPSGRRWSWRCQQWGGPMHPGHVSAQKTTHGHEQTPNIIKYNLHETHIQKGWLEHFTHITCVNI